jgi:uncharacterized surface protein with fasciclin (FAS1) repeats
MIHAFKHSLANLARLSAIVAATSIVSLPAIAESGSMSGSTPAAPNALPAVVVPTKPVAPATPQLPSPQNIQAPTAAPTTPAEAAATPKASDGTIVEVAAANDSFETLVKAVKAAGLAEVLSGEGPFTVFAPTDEAFAALPKETVEMLLKPENKETLKQILSYHVIPGSVESSTLKAGKVQTVQGTSVSVSIMDKKVMVNDAVVTTADIKASNGVIHVIDKVILPPGL